MVLLHSSLFVFEECEPCNVILMLNFFNPSFNSINKNDINSHYFPVVFPNEENPKKFFLFVMINSCPT